MSALSRAASISSLLNRFLASSSRLAWSVEICLRCLLTTLADDAEDGDGDVGEVILFSLMSEVLECDDESPAAEAWARAR